jgi:hypothetical protein
MGFSKYPRFGQRIAPAILRDILEAEIPSGILPGSAVKFRKLADLDESIWHTTSGTNCKLLAKLVVKEVHRNLRRLPLMLRISTLSSPTSKIPLASLELQVRTYKALRMKFGDEIPTETQIRGLPHIRNFGACCMVDLLVAVEFFSNRPSKARQLELSIQTEPSTIVSSEDWPSRIEVEISHYPRPGYRIAPKALKSVLNVPAWSQRLAHMQLCDLDESTWGKISPAQCRKLAAAVIERVKIIHGSLRNVAEQIKLPMPKTKGKPINLQLERRTFNCLNKMGLLDNPSRLAQMTVADLTGMSGFGVKSIVDLLSSLESQISEAYVATPEVLAAAQTLSRIKNADGLRTDDPRFGLALQALRINGKNLQEICDAVLAGAPCPMNSELFASRLGEILSTLKAVRRITLENELLDLLAFEPKARDRDFTIRLLGWDGNGGETLEAIGKASGITRERIVK